MCGRWPGTYREKSLISACFLFKKYVFFYISMWTDVDKTGSKLARPRVQAETGDIFYPSLDAHGTAMGPPFQIQCGDNLVILSHGFGPGARISARLSETGSARLLPFPMSHVRVIFGCGKPHSWDYF